jgi:hypothetical protein
MLAEKEALLKTQESTMEEVESLLKKEKEANYWPRAKSVIAPFKKRFKTLRTKHPRFCKR